MIIEWAYYNITQLQRYFAGGLILNWAGQDKTLGVIVDPAIESLTTVRAMASLTTERIFESHTVEREYGSATAERELESLTAKRTVHQT